MKNALFNQSLRIFTVFEQASADLSRVWGVSRIWRVLLIVGLFCTGSAVATTHADERADQMAAAQALVERGEFRSALAAFEKLRLMDPDFSTDNDVDYRVVLAALEVPAYDQVWEAAERWISAQPTSLQSLLSEEKLNSTTAVEWSSRQTMLGQVLMARVQAAYHLALNAESLSNQSEWFSRCRTEAQRLQALKPTGELRDSVNYYSHLVRLQELLNQSSESEELEKLALAFQTLAQESQSSDLVAKCKYYQAVALESAGRVSNALQLWTDLLKDTQLSDNVRRSTLMTVAENYLSRWFVAESSGDEHSLAVRQQSLDESRRHFQMLQQEFPQFETSRVAFNLGTCLRLLGYHDQAIAQFQKIPWPSDPAADPGQAALAWQSQFNLARSMAALEQFPAAVEATNLALERLAYATETSGGQAILLRMRLAENAADWQMVLALSKKGQAWLAAVPQHTDEISYLTAWAQSYSLEPADRDDGLRQLQTIADSANAFANMAKYRLLALNVALSTPERQITARPDLDQELDAVQQSRWTAIANDTANLLTDPELNIDSFPRNPSMLDRQQIRVLEQRKHVREWQADALYKLREYEKANSAFQSLIQEYPDDTASPDWQMKRTFGLLQIGQLDAAIAALDPTVIPNWDRSQQAEAWFILGELRSKREDFLLAAQAYEKAVNAGGSFAKRSVAAQRALLAYDRSMDYQQVIAAAKKWEAETGAETPLNEIDLAFLKLQRGRALFELKQYNEAEAAFREVVQMEKVASPSDRQRLRTWDRLMVDAQINLSVTLQQLSKNDEAQEILKDFLAKHSEHEHRDLATQMLKSMDPTWQPSPTIAGDDAKETSGSSILNVENVFQAVEQHLAEKQWNEAIVGLRQLAADAFSDAGHDRFIYLLGWALREQGSPQDALDAWQQLIDIYPQSRWLAWVEYHRGEVAYAAGDYPAAVARFQSARSTTVDPQVRLNAIYLEAWSEWQQNNFDVAKQKFQILIDLATEAEQNNPLVVEAQAMLGKCEFKAGRFAEALSAFQKVAPQLEAVENAKPELKYQVQLHAGKAALAIRQFPEAVKWLTSCVESAIGSEQVSTADSRETAEARYLLGVAYRHNNQSTLAREQLEKISPRTDLLGMQALSELGEIAKSLDDETSLRQYYQALANGAYGEDLSSEAKELRATALWEMGISLLRSANQQSDSAVRAEHIRQAKTWLARAQLQTDSAEISQRAERQLELIPR